MKNLTPEQEADIICSGSAEVVSRDELISKIKRSRDEKQPLRIKYGADPSAPDIHLGHAVCLYKLKELQDLGHKVIFLIGDFTGMIGDPSGLSKTRTPLSKEKIELNAKTYTEQVSKILDIEKAEVSYNSIWHADMNFEEVLRLCSKYTVARILERDDFAKRLKAESPIGIHELLYPLIQGYDSVMLKADIELGGTDQKFNFLLARDLQREYGQEPQVALMMPILVGTDGKDKMSKSLGNHIGIAEEPKEIFGKLMSIPDEVMESYYRLISRLPEEEIDSIFKDIESGKLNPRDAKMRLAHIITARFHSEEDAMSAEEEFKRVFSQGGLPDDIPEIEVKLKDGKVWLIGLIEREGLVSSRSEARRLLSQGAIYLNDRRVKGSEEDISVKDGDILKVGKRKFAKLVIKD
ncbi:MAG TPA: tyrosine--tRNA ligase [Firmicutes bacterium]|nr:tyrosine--tRNA ligase [Bacillota bacterium]